MDKGAALTALVAERSAGRGAVRRGRPGRPAGLRGRGGPARGRCTLAWRCAAGRREVTEPGRRKRTWWSTGRRDLALLGCLAARSAGLDTSFEGGKPARQRSMLRSRNLDQGTLSWRPGVRRAVRPGPGRRWGPSPARRAGRAPQLAGEPAARRHGRAASASARQLRTRSASGMTSASCSASAVALMSNGLTSSASLAELVGRAGLAGQHQRAATVGQDRAFLGDQVHAVPDRVDQQHVGQPVRGQRPGEVVVHLEHQRLPVRRCRTRR